MSFGALTYLNIWSPCLKNVAAELEKFRILLQLIILFRTSLKMRAKPNVKRGFFQIHAKKWLGFTFFLFVTFYTGVVKISFKNPVEEGDQLVALFRAEEDNFIPVRILLEVLGSDSMDTFIIILKAPLKPTDKTDNAFNLMEEIAVKFMKLLHDPNFSNNPYGKVHQNLEAESIRIESLLPHSNRFTADGTGLDEETNRLEVVAIDQKRIIILNFELFEAMRKLNKLNLLVQSVVSPQTEIVVHTKSSDIASERYVIVRTTKQQSTIIDLVKKLHEIVARSQGFSLKLRSYINLESGYDNMTHTEQVLSKFKNRFCKNLHNFEQAKVRIKNLYQ